MKYVRLGKTELMVSQVGFGAEWLGKIDDDQIKALMDTCLAGGMNIVDCWMSDPAIRDALGKGIADARDKWIIQGHIGSTWQDGQYVRTRDMKHVVPAFEDMLTRLGVESVELGMIHYVDDVDEFDQIMAGSDYLEYVRDLKRRGVIKHIGLSTHNPEVGLRAVACGEIEMIMFSINPAFDMLPASNDIETLFAETYEEGLTGIDPQREELYAACEREDIGITVMKGFAGGRLLDAQKSPFGVALTPVQCLHYALTRPAVASVLVGIESIEQAGAALAYCTATDEEKDYASVLASAPKHAYYGECTYCGHCAPCVVGINIALVNKFADLAKMQDSVPEGVGGHYADLDVTASACIGCRACESRCPFGVAIADRMEETAALFGF